MTLPMYEISSISYVQILALINHTKTQLIHSAIKNGIASPETVSISQQLDYYLNLELNKRINVTNGQKSLES